jgi:hypothetical protein
MSTPEAFSTKKLVFHEYRQLVDAETTFCRILEVAVISQKMRFFAEVPLRTSVIRLCKFGHKPAKSLSILMHNRARKKKKKRYKKKRELALVFLLFFLFFLFLQNKMVP